MPYIVWLNQMAYIIVNYFATKDVGKCEWVWLIKTALGDSRPFLSAPENVTNTLDVQKRFPATALEKTHPSQPHVKPNVPWLQTPTGGSYPGSLGRFLGRETATRPASLPKRCTYLADTSSWWAAATPRWEIYSLHDKQDLICPLCSFTGGLLFKWYSQAGHYHHGLVTGQCQSES